MWVATPDRLNRKQLVRWLFNCLCLNFWPSVFEMCVSLQGVVAYMLPVEVFVTVIKIFDEWNCAWGSPWFLCQLFKRTLNAFDPGHKWFTNSFNVLSYSWYTTCWVWPTTPGFAWRLTRMSSHQWIRRLPSSAVPTGWRERSVKKSKVASTPGPRCFVPCRKLEAGASALLLL